MRPWRAMLDAIRRGGRWRLALAAALVLVTMVGCGSVPWSKEPSQAFMKQVANDPFPTAKQSGVTGLSK